MSNTLAVAAVTSTLRYVLERALQAVAAGAGRRARSHDAAPGELADRDDPELPGHQRVPVPGEPEPALEPRDLPTRRDDGSLSPGPGGAVTCTT